MPLSIEAGLLFADLFDELALPEAQVKVAQVRHLPRLDAAGEADETPSFRGALVCRGVDRLGWLGRQLFAGTHGCCDACRRERHGERPADPLLEVVVGGA